MTEIITALRSEADGVIRRLHMKTEKTAFPFPSFHNEDGSIRLTISGAGKAVAAAAVGCILGRYGREDLPDVQLVNFGSCALWQSSSSRSGNTEFSSEERLYLVNKLIDLDSGATYYPDLLVRTDLPEAEIATGSRVLGEDSGKIANRDLDQDFDDRRQMANLAAVTDMHSRVAGSGSISEGFSAVTLYDMEAAGIYGAARLFLGPHQLHFLKGVTDRGTDENGRIDAAAFRERMDHYAAAALPYIQSLADTTQHMDNYPTGEKETALTDKISDVLHASVMMRLQIRQLVRYAVLAGIDAETIFDQCMAMHDGSCRDRREGKLLLAQLCAAIAGQ